jgi:transcriptional regulator with XRE-family HTH domain
MAMQRELALALANNLQRLMANYRLPNGEIGLSQAELGRKSGIGQRTISTLLDVDDSAAINPRASTLEQLAHFFDIPVWQFLIPDMPLELLLSKRVTKLIENYRDAPEDGRVTVERIAESEVKYAVAESVLIGKKKAGTGG